MEVSGCAAGMSGCRCFGSVSLHLSGRLSLSGGKDVPQLLQAYFLFLLTQQPPQKECCFLSRFSKIPGVKVIG